MPEMDRELLLEALSALTGATVKPLDYGIAGASTILTVHNFLSTALNSVDGVTALATSLTKLALGINEIVNLHNELFVDVDSFLDPRYDYDFRKLTDFSACSRGGEPYTRPNGWYRFALKVKDKYPDGNAWLGSVHWRTHSEAGEWPVSFHGTSIEAAKEIARSHYKPGGRQAYGRGIYSTPDIRIAEMYAMSKKFTSVNTGKTYKVIMQNRINPQRRVIIHDKNFWLIQVPENITAEQEKDMVETSIRPYGILIKEDTQ